jgi:hypothetical protein
VAVRKQFERWPRDAPATMPVEDVARMYANGWAGLELRRDKIAQHRAEFNAWIDGQAAATSSDGGAIATAAGFAGSGRGALSLVFPQILHYYPRALPGPAQQRGDCVSHGQKNANLGAVAAAVFAGTPDEVTGSPRGMPKISAEGVRSGAFSTEAIYWYRGSGSDGWMCDAAARVSTTKAGSVVRRAYPDAGIDLTTYSGILAGTYGRRPPPDNIAAALDDHLIRTATRLEGWEQLADFMANGYPCNSCGGEGFSSVRDEFGASRRSGSWSHSMAYLGVDARPWVEQQYNTPCLVLMQNSWGRFNSGPRRIYKTQIDIPEGSFWAQWGDISRRGMVAMSSAMAWPPQVLPNWIPEGII